jgi:hypothetical protein
MNWLNHSMNAGQFSATLWPPSCRMITRIRTALERFPVFSARKKAAR